MGMDGYLGPETWTIYINFGPLFPMMLHINLGLIGQVISEKEDLWKWWTDGRWVEGYTISIT